MYVSLKDKENTIVRQRISQLIQPIKSSRVAASRSQRKVLQQLFQPDDNQMFERDSLDGGKCDQNIVVACSDTKSTQRMEYRHIVTTSETKNIDSMAVLERQLSQTRAVAKLEESNLQRKMENLTERIELLEQENSSLLMHNRRLKERNELQQGQSYELERRLIVKQAELSKEYEGKLSAMTLSIQQKDIELMELRTNSSKYRVDTSCELEDARREIDVLRRNLAQRDYRFAELEAKYSLGRVEMEANMVRVFNEAKEANHRLEQQCIRLKDEYSRVETIELVDKARIKELERQLEASFTKYKSLKVDWNTLSDIESKKQQLERNEKKLVRKCQLLEQRMLEKNERVNEMILNYENEIEGMRKTLAVLSSKQQAVQQSNTKQAMQLQIRTLTEERNNTTKAIASLQRQLSCLTSELNGSREKHHFEMRLKDDKIGLLDRQLVERDCQIQRLIKHERELELRCNDIIRSSQVSDSHMEYNVSYHMHSSYQRQALRKKDELPRHHINSSQYLQQKSSITQLQLQLDSTVHNLQSTEEELKLKNSEIVEMGKVMESQLSSLRQLKRMLEEKDDVHSDKQRTIFKLESQLKRQLTNIVELQLRINEQETCRTGFIERYGICIEPLVSVHINTSNQDGTVSQQSTSSTIRNFYNRLRQRMADLQSIRSRLLQTTQTNGYLQQQNLHLSTKSIEQSQRINDLEHNQQLNEELIIRIEEQSKAQLEQLRVNLQQKYEVLYEKYIKYRRILQKQKERKELQKVIIKDSNHFNDEIVERCKELLR